MARHNGIRVEDLYKPSINWGRAAKIGIPFVGGAVALGWFIPKFLSGDIDATKTEANIRNPTPIAATGPAPRDIDISKPPQKEGLASVHPTEKKPIGTYSGVTERELDAFMEEFGLPDRGREAYKRVLEKIPNVVKKGIYVKHEIAEVRDGPNASGLAQDKMIIVYSWHKKGDGKEYKIMWLFKPPNENQSHIFYKRF